ncbi:MAG: hypothetical protein ACI90U_000382 [Pseudomonadales bacterium]|jgi:hypothetical protein
MQALLKAGLYEQGLVSAVSANIIIDRQAPKLVVIKVASLVGKQTLGLSLYEWHNHFATLDKNTVYVLYWGKGESIACRVLKNKD